MTLSLEELPMDDNNTNNEDKQKKQEYFLNKGRKILLSKFSKIKFIKNISNQLKSLNKNDNEDIQILIQLNQTIKNLNQNIISDINSGKNKEKIKSLDSGKENFLLNKKKYNKDN